jgi:thiamine-phosphate pyrophosphorylase
MAHALPAGSGIIFRHYNAENRMILASKVSKICENRQITLLIAQDARLADQVGAAGCHLPEYMIDKAPELRTRFSKLLFSGSCHSAENLAQAEQAALDLAFLSPFNPTASHPGAKSLNVVTASNWVQGCGLPIYALGGVGPDNIPQLTALGFTGFGAISQLEKKYL